MPFLPPVPKSTDTNVLHQFKARVAPSNYYLFFLYIFQGKQTPDIFSTIDIFSLSMTLFTG